MAGQFTFYEFFAGGGMARAGLGRRWACLRANDIDAKKAAVYRENWGGEELVLGDIGDLSQKDLPGTADLAWASFPCQDLSLAGKGKGLAGKRSGTFWEFSRIIDSLSDENRAPASIVLENVYGTLTSRDGKDFALIIDSLVGSGYRVGAMIVDASLFVPQSRKRLFIVAFRSDIQIDSELLLPSPILPWHPDAILKAFMKLPIKSKQEWLWFNVPLPRKRAKNFVDIIEDEPLSVKWHSQAETRKLISMMTEGNLEKLRTVKREGVRKVGGVYKRTRAGIQRAEVRFDDIAGCLRTPAGGSSRQTIIVVEGNKVRSRLLSAREAARLMGLSDSYRLPQNYNAAYHVAGDGVVVPVVRHIAGALIEPTLANTKNKPMAL